MEQTVKEMWEETLVNLGEMSDEKRKHFALLLITLAQCYDPDSDAKAVLVVQDANGGDALAMFSIGATEMDSAEMVGRANEIVNAMVTADAPAKEMFN